MSEDIPYWLQSKLSFNGRYAAIPESTKYALTQWAIRAQKPGSFVEAVLRNDLHDAFDKADTGNLVALQLIVSWVHCELPTDAWLAPNRLRADRPAPRDRLSYREDEREQLYQFKGYLPSRQDDRQILEEDDGEAP